MGCHSRKLFENLIDLFYYILQFWTHIASQKEIEELKKPAKENCVGSFHESFGKKPKENPIPLQNYRKEGASCVYAIYNNYLLHRNYDYLPIYKI